MGKQIKILLIADSYALPRLAIKSAQVELKYLQTYPEKLRRNLHNKLNAEIVLLTLAEHAQVTTCLQVDMPMQVRFLEPDYIIIQLGLADLWPATVKRGAPRYPFLQGCDPWVTLAEYRANIKNFVAYCRRENSAVQVLLINIPWVSENQYWRNPEAYERTQTYNNCLQELSEQLKIILLDWYSLSKQLSEQILGSDELHLNAVGSSLLGSELANKIIQQVGESDG